MMDLREALRLAFLPEKEDSKQERGEAEKIVCQLIRQLVGKLARGLCKGDDSCLDILVASALARVGLAFKRKPERLTTMVSNGQAVNYIKHAIQTAIKDFLRQNKRQGEWNEEPPSEHQRDEFVERSDWARRIESGVAIETAVHAVLNEAWDTPGFPQPSVRTRQKIGLFWNDFFRLGCGEVSESELTRVHHGLARPPRPNEIEAFLRSFKRAREVVIDDLLLAEMCFGRIEARMAMLEFIIHCWQRAPKNILEKSHSRVKLRWPECP